MSHDGIEKGKLEDLPRILQIYASARKFMKQSGNPPAVGRQFSAGRSAGKGYRKKNSFTL